MGYHALSVQAVLEKSGLSRPTFYKHFSNIDEAVRIVIARAHDGLVDRLINDVPRDASIEEKVERAARLYLEWVESLGPLLRPFYIELHDPASPVSELRPQVLRRIGELYMKMLQTSGATVQNPLLADLMITGIEFLGYRYHLERTSGQVTLEMIHDAIARLMYCSLLSPEALAKGRRPARARRSKH